MTKHFLYLLMNQEISIISTRHPLKDRERAHRYRYALLSSGSDQECFHATEDSQIVRDNIFDFIDTCDDFFIDSVIAEKNKANPSLYTESYYKKGKEITLTTGAEFYRIVCQTLLQYVFKRFQIIKNLSTYIFTNQGQI